MKLVIIYMRSANGRCDAARTQREIVGFPQAITALENAARRAEIRGILGSPVYSEYSAVAENGEYCDIDVFEISGQNS